MFSNNLQKKCPVLVIFGHYSLILQPLRMNRSYQQCNNLLAITIIYCLNVDIHNTKGLAFQFFQSHEGCFKSAGLLSFISLLLFLLFFSHFILPFLFSFRIVCNLERSPAISYFLLTCFATEIILSFCMCTQSYKINNQIFSCCNKFLAIPTIEYL